MANRVDRFASRITKMQNAAARAQTRAKLVKAKTKLKNAKTAYRAARGSKKAAKRLESAASSKARMRIEAKKPGLYEKERLAEIQTKSDVKKATAKYTGYAGVATALTGGYSAGEESKSKAKIKQAEADIAAANALENSIGAIPEIQTDEASVSGLVTGVR